VFLILLFPKNPGKRICLVPSSPQALTCTSIDISIIGENQIL
jgi:hypothetical protein